MGKQGASLHNVPWLSQIHILLGEARDFHLSTVFVFAFERWKYCWRQDWFPRGERQPNWMLRYERMVADMIRGRLLTFGSTSTLGHDSLPLTGRKWWPKAAKRAISSSNLAVPPKSS